jgi:hypothetical protein
MRRWEDNIRMDVREIELGGVDWMHLAEDKDQWLVLGKTVTKLQTP